jgi:hypothetical protein
VRLLAEATQSSAAPASACRVFKTILNTLKPYDEEIQI